MLREIPNVLQIPGEGRRRWFTDSYFDLIVWYKASGMVSGFQLSYDKRGRERSFTWREEHQCVHEEVDHGETTSMPGADSSIPAPGIGERFLRECADIDDRSIVRLVWDTIDRCQSKLKKVARVAREAG